MGNHALLSASSAHRWLACTPSARLEEQYPDSKSTYAEEGSLAHSVAELKLRKYIIEPMSTRKYNSELKKLQENALFDTEMLTHTETYLEYVKHIVHGFHTKPYVVAEKRVDYSAYAPEGFGTADCIMVADNTIHIIDFKYGKGVEVSAEKNPQMMLYALGAYMTYTFLFNINTIKLAIVQPRIYAVSEYEMSLSELLDWGESIKPLAQKAYAGEGDQIWGDHCRFCRVANCRTRSEENLKLAGFEKRLPPALTNEELGEVLNKAKDLVKWVEKLEDFALVECLAGRDVPGWKAVEGRSNRVLRDLDEAFKKLQKNGVAEMMLYEKKPLTLTALEKLVGKKELESCIGDYIEKPKGKPTLATMDDKREPWINNVNPTEVFKN